MTFMTSGKKIGLFSRLLIGVGLAVYGLALAEAFLQIFAPQPLFPRYITGTPYGIRGNIPGAEYRHYTAEVNVGFRINKQGMRSDRDFPFEKPADVCRIVMLGDSFFMGYELEMPDTIAARLEKRLKDDGYAVEILNLAVSGLGTAESLVTYKEYARRFAPDLVLLEWDRSDFNDNIRSGLYRMAEGNLVQTSNAYLPSVALQDKLNEYALYRYIAGNSELYAFAREQISVAVRRLTVSVPFAINKWRSMITGDAPKTAAEPTPDEGESDKPAKVDPKNSFNPAAVKLAGGLLTEFKRQTSADGVDLLILEMPFTLGRTAFYSTLEAIPAETRSTLPILSPVELFRATGRPDLKLFFERGNGHFTPSGVDLLMRELAPRLEQSPNLGRCRKSR